MVEQRNYELSEIKKELTVDSNDVTRVVEHLKVIKEFVSRALVEGEDNDYGVIPGVRKKMLFKPGAEKLMRLFGLGVRFNLLDKDFDRIENFAMYEYQAEVYHLKTGVVISQCEGTSSSQEKKYKERAIYKNGKKVGVEPTPVCDIVNTLKKMAQKRAMVGAVIIATGASDYFSQDPEEYEAQQPIRKQADTEDHSKFTGQPKSNFGEFLLTFGKYNGKKLCEISKEDLDGYFDYLKSTNPEPKGKLKEFIDTAREYLRTL